MKPAAILIAAFMILGPSGNGKAMLVPAMSSLTHGGRRGGVISVATPAPMRKPSGTFALPKPVAILVLTFLFLYALHGLITGSVSPGPGSPWLHRSEEPELYWWLWFGTVAGFILLGVLVCKMAKILPTGRPLNVAIILLISVFFYIFVARGLITGTIVLNTTKSRGRGPIYRSEQPRQYWFFLALYAVLYAVWAVWLCKSVKLF